MDRVILNRSGDSISRLAYGWWKLVEWNLTTAEVEKHIEQCIDLGLTTHDHADIYGDYQCEALYGQALAKAPHLRDKIELVSKCGINLVSRQRPEYHVKAYDTSYQHIVKSVERSLINLHTEYLDLLLIHRPDPLMDADEVCRAFEHLKDTGKVKHFGVSNFANSQIELLQSRLNFPLVVNQVEISVLALDSVNDGTLDYCQQKQMIPMAWSSLAGGRLFTANDDTTIRVRSQLNVMAEKYHASIDQLAIAWLLKHPANIVPVLGSRSLARLQDSVGALDAELSRQDWFAILQASTGAEVP